MIRSSRHLLLLPVLLLLLASGRAQDAGRQWLVLRKSQLLEGAGGFPAFTEEHRGRKRSELREEVVRRLEEIAAEGRAEFLSRLGRPSVGRELWIVNAVVVTLTDAERKAAEGMDEVLAVFPAGHVPLGAPPGKLNEVLQPVPEKPFTTRGKKVGWNLAELRVPEVWRRLKVTGEGALVVSYDNGLNYQHEDLRRRIALNPREIPDNGVDDDGNGFPDDYQGFDFTREKADVIAKDARQHGSLTASVIVGDGTGGFVTGVAPRAKVLPIIAAGGAYLYALALQYVVERGGDVVNMSLSIPDLGETRGFYRMVAEHATCAGLVLVSGAGNFQKQAQVPAQIRIPEGIPCVVCVGGVTRGHQVPDFVSLGPVEWESVPLYGDFPMPEGLVKPDLVAFPGPGIPMIATENEGYMPASNRRRGNSLSAPHVAGVAALMLSANPELTAFRVKEILEETAEDLPPKGKDPRTGCGLVDAYAAVMAARE